MHFVLYSTPLKKLIKRNQMRREFLQKYSPLSFNFYQNKNDFIVNEEPIEFTQKGNFIILKTKKINLGTWDLIEKFAKSLNIYEHEIGYAGLKDKNATTTQYISIPKKYSKELNKFKHNKIEILDSFLHTNKLNIGDLKANSFEINLHNVTKDELFIIEKRVKEICKIGMPNYFGFQRFGKDVKENLAKAKKVVEGELKIKDKKLEKMLIATYQSTLFNQCLSKRVKLSKNEFKLLSGDMFLDLQKEKIFTPKYITPQIIDDFKDKKIVPTGLLAGRDVLRSLSEARTIEEQFDDTSILHKGFRRSYLVYPKSVNIKFNEKESMCKLFFTLPKASYATVLIENIQNRNIIIK